MHIGGTGRMEYKMASKMHKPIRNAPAFLASYFQSRSGQQALKVGQEVHGRPAVPNDMTAAFLLALAKNDTRDAQVDALGVALAA